MDKWEYDVVFDRLCFSKCDDMDVCPHVSSLEGFLVYMEMSRCSEASLVGHHAKTRQAPTRLSQGWVGGLKF